MPRSAQMLSPPICYAPSDPVTARARRRGARIRSSSEENESDRGRIGWVFNRLRESANVHGHADARRQIEEVRCKGVKPGQFAATARQHEFGEHDFRRAVLS